MPKPQKETISVPSPGRWSWNDETQALEFTSFNTSVEVKEKRKKTKPPVAFKDPAKFPERLAQSSASGGRGRHSTRKTVGPAQLSAYKSSVKRGQRDYVTIEDVKQEALNLLLEDEALPIPLGFLALLRSRELDDFLAALLLYLSCYFERKSLEKKPKPLMAEQSITEKQVMAETLARVDLAQKQLAFCYSSLVLGQGLHQEHHMACGRSRVSSTYKDRQLYECLYSFACFVSWVTFKRKDLRGVQQEVGRLLRSDTFNPASRTAPEDQGDACRQDPAPSGSASSASAKEGKGEGHHGHTPDQRKGQQQRRRRRRPALCGMMTQRSPVMVSLLPSPREKAPHLFLRRGLDSPAQKGRRRRQDAPNGQTPPALLEELSRQLDSISFGILGKPLSQFNAALMPQNEDEEDEDDEDAGVQGRGSSRTSFAPQRTGSGALDKSGSDVRADTGVSHVTTEGVSSESDTE